MFVSSVLVVDVKLFITNHCGFCSGLRFAIPDPVDILISARFRVTSPVALYCNCFL